MTDPVMLSERVRYVGKVTSGDIYTQFSDRMFPTEREAWEDAKAMRDALAMRGFDSLRIDTRELLA